MKPRKSRANLGVIGTTGGKPIRAVVHRGWLTMRVGGRGGRVLSIHLRQIWLGQGGPMDLVLDLGEQK